MAPRAAARRCYHDHMHILHVVAGLPPAGGGLSELVPRLAIEAARLGHDVTIATVADRDEPLSAAAYEAAACGVRIATFTPAAPRPFFFSWAMCRHLPKLVLWADVVHVHSNWTFPVWWACLSALRLQRPLVMSPQGCLDPVRLAHSAWKKRVAGLLDRRFLRRATLIHATSPAEEAWIRRYVGGKPWIAMIPNGVDLRPLPASPKADPRTRQVLFLGRLHPLKGLDLLLDAWARVGAAKPDKQAWHLVIAGPDEQGTRKRLEELTRQRGLTTVSFIGAVYGADKARALDEADIFVLPSRSENFGIAVAEALAAGVPVITTKGTPWGEIAGSCGWWVDTTAAAIGAALDEAMRLTDADRAALGAEGRRLVENRYQWPAVGRAMTDSYHLLADGIAQYDEPQRP